MFYEIKVFVLRIYTVRPLVERGLYKLKGKGGGVSEK